MAEPTLAPRSPSNPGWNPLTLALLGGIWIASIGNWPLWLELTRQPEMASPRGILFCVGFGSMIAALTTALLALTAWRPVIRPVLAFWLLSTAIGAYFMGVYSVVLDPTMMNNVIQTDPREIGDLLSRWFVLNLVGVAGVPIVWLWLLRVDRRSLAGQAARNVLAVVGCVAVTVALVFAFYADLSATMRNHRSLRYLINPVNAFYSLGVLVKEATDRPSGSLEKIGLDAHVAPRAPGAHPPLLVLVVGETARADHFALNGYPRPTDPELSGIGVASYRHVTSCGTNTAASLPCMFSPLDRTAFEARKRDEENLLDLVQHAGMAVLWLDNQSGCKGLCDRVPHAAAIDPAPGAPPLPPGLCRDGECYDEALLWHLDTRLAALPAERRARGVLIVLHQMGSHGPAYYKRSPRGRKPFKPECETTVLQECPLETVINAYDNSIAYTDHVLADTIHWLQGHAGGYDPTLLYMSDHGESLGENNLYLHGLPYALAPSTQTHVPFIAWRLPGAPVAGEPDLGCLRSRIDIPLTHDAMFHTVVGLLDIETGVYRKSLDAFAPCRNR